jgi:hypothetical protein
MSIYLVTYDLNKETVRPKITTEVKKTAYAQLSESSYAIETNESPEDVYSRFTKLLDGNDNFYVIGLKHPYTGFGPQAVNKWLAENLTY